MVLTGCCSLETSMSSLGPPVGLMQERAALQHQAGKGAGLLVVQCWSLADVNVVVTARQQHAVTID